MNVCDDSISFVIFCVCAVGIVLVIAFFADDENEMVKKEQKTYECMYTFAGEECKRFLIDKNNKQMSSECKQ